MSQASSQKSRAEDDAKLQQLLSRAELSSDLTPVLKELQRDGEWDLGSQRAESVRRPASSTAGTETPVSPMRKSKAHWQDAARKVMGTSPTLASKSAPTDLGKKLKSVVRDAHQNEGAKRATKQYKANLDLLLVKVEEAQKERDVAEAEMKKMRMKVKDLKGDLAQWEAKDAIFTAAQQQAKQLRDKLKAADAQALSAAEDLAGSRAKCMSAEERVAELEALLAARQSSTTEALRSVEDDAAQLRRDHKKNISDLEDKIEALETQLSQMRRDKASLESAMDSKGSRSDEMAAELRSAKEAAAALERLIAEQKDVIKGLEDAAGNDKRQLRDSEDTMARLKREGEALKADITTAERARSQAQEKEVQLQDEILTLRKDATGLRDDLKEKEADQKAAERDMKQQQLGREDEQRELERKLRQLQDSDAHQKDIEKKLRQQLEESEADQRQLERKLRQQLQDREDEQRELERKLRQQQDRDAQQTEAEHRLKQQLQGQEAEQRELEQRLQAQLRASYSSADEKHRDAQHAVDAARIERDILADERDGLKDERDSLKDERDGLKDERNGLKDERDGLKDEVAKLRNALSTLNTFSEASRRRHAVLTSLLARTECSLMEAQEASHVVAAVYQSEEKRLVPQVEHQIQRQLEQELRADTANIRALTEVARTEVKQEVVEKLRTDVSEQTALEKEVKATLKAELKHANEEAYLQEAKTELIQEMFSETTLRARIKDAVVSEVIGKRSTAGTDAPLDAKDQMMQEILLQASQQIEDKDGERIRQEARNRLVQQYIDDLCSSPQSREAFRHQAMEECLVARVQEVKASAQMQESLRARAEEVLLAEAKAAMIKSIADARGISDMARAQLVEEERQLLLLSAEEKERARTKAKEDLISVEKAALLASDDARRDIRDAARAESIREARSEIDTSGERALIRERAREELLNARKTELETSREEMLAVSEEAQQLLITTAKDTMQASDTTMQEVATTARTALVDIEKRRLLTASSAPSTRAGHEGTPTLPEDVKTEALEAYLHDRSAVEETLQEALRRQILEEEGQALYEKARASVEVQLREGIENDKGQYDELVERTQKSLQNELMTEEGSTIMQRARDALLQAAMDEIRSDEAVQKQVAAEASDAVVKSLIGELTSDKALSEQLRYAAEQQIVDTLLKEEAEELRVTALHRAADEVSRRESEALLSEARAQLLASSLEELSADAVRMEALRAQAEAGVAATAKEELLRTHHDDIMRRALEAAISEEQARLTDTPVVLEAAKSRAVEQCIAEGGSAMMDTARASAMQNVVAQMEKSPELAQAASDAILYQVMSDQCKDEELMQTLRQQAQDETYKSLLLREKDALLRNAQERVAATEGQVLYDEARDMLCATVLEEIRASKDGARTVRARAEKALEEEYRCDPVVQEAARDAALEHLARTLAADRDAFAQLEQRLVSALSEAVKPAQSPGAHHDRDYLDGIASQVAEKIVASGQSNDAFSSAVESTPPSFEDRITSQILQGTRVSPLQPSAAALLRRAEQRAYDELCAEARADPALLDRVVRQVEVDMMQREGAAICAEARARLAEEVLQDMRDGGDGNTVREMPKTGKEHDELVASIINKHVVDQMPTRKELPRAEPSPLSEQDHADVQAEARAKLLTSALDAVSPQEHEELRQAARDSIKRSYLEDSSLMRPLRAEVESDIRRTLYSEACATPAAASVPTSPTSPTDAMTGTSPESHLHESIAAFRARAEAREREEHAVRTEALRLSAMQDDVRAALQSSVQEDVTTREAERLCMEARAALLEEVTSALRSDAVLCEGIRAEVLAAMTAEEASRQRAAQNAVAAAESGDLCAEARSVLLGETMQLLREDLSQLAEIEREASDIIRKSIVEKANTVAEADGEQICAEAKQILLEGAISELKADTAAHTTLLEEARKEVQREERTAAQATVHADSAAVLAEARDALYTEVLAAQRSDPALMHALQKQCTDELRAEHTAALTEADRSHLQASARQMFTEEADALLRADSVQMAAIEQSVRERVEGEARLRHEHNTNVVAEAEAADICVQAREALYEETVAALRTDTAAMASLKAAALQEVKADVLKRESLAANAVASSQGAEVCADARQALYVETVAVLRENPRLMKDLQQEAAAELRQEVLLSERAQTTHTHEAELRPTRLQESEVQVVVKEVREPRLDSTTHAETSQDRKRAFVDSVLSAFRQQVEADKERHHGESHAREALLAEQEGDALVSEARLLLSHEIKESMKADPHICAELEAEAAVSLKDEILMQHMLRESTPQAVAAEARALLLQELAEEIRQDEVLLSALRTEAHRAVQAELAEELPVIARTARERFTESLVEELNAEPAQRQAIHRAVTRLLSASPARERANVSHPLSQMKHKNVKLLKERSANEPFTDANEAIVQEFIRTIESDAAEMQRLRIEDEQRRHASPSPSAQAQTEALLREAHSVLLRGLQAELENEADTRDASQPRDTRDDAEREVDILYKVAEARVLENIARGRSASPRIASVASVHAHASPGQPEEKEKLHTLPPEEVRDVVLSLYNDLVAGGIKNVRSNAALYTRIHAEAAVLCAPFATRDVPLPSVLEAISTRLRDGAQHRLISRAVVLLNAEHTYQHVLQQKAQELGPLDEHVPRRVDQTKRARLNRAAVTAASEVQCYDASALRVLSEAAASRVLVSDPHQTVLNNSMAVVLEEDVYQHLAHVHAHHSLSERALAVLTAEVLVLRDIRAGQEQLPSPATVPHHESVRMLEHTISLVRPPEQVPQVQQVPISVQEEVHTESSVHVASAVYTAVSDSLVHAIKNDAAVVQHLKTVVRSEEDTRSDLHGSEAVLRIRRDSLAALQRSRQPLTSGSEQSLVNEMAARMRDDPATLEKVRADARVQLQDECHRETWRRAAHEGVVGSMSKLPTPETPEQAALASLSTNYRAEIAAEARAVVLDQMRDEVAQSQSEGLDGQITVLLRRAQLQVQEEMCSEMRRDESVLASIQAEPLTPVSGDVAVFEKIQALGTVAAARVEDEIAAHREDEVSADESRVVCEQVCLEVETKILHELVADMKRDDNVMVELQAVASADEDTAAMVRIKSDAVSALQWSRRGTVPPGSEQSLVNEMAARMRDDPATLEKVRADARVQLQDECHRETWRRAAHEGVVGSMSKLPTPETPEQVALASLSTNYRAEIAAEARAVVIADVKREAAQSQGEGLDGQITVLLRRAQLQVQEEMCSEMRRDESLLASIQAEPLTPVSGDVAVFEKIQALGTVAAARVEDEIAAHREDEVSADESRVVCEQVCLEVETKILHELVADMKRDDNVMVELQAMASAEKQMLSAVAQSKEVAEVRSTTEASYTSTMTESQKLCAMIDDIKADEAAMAVLAQYTDKLTVSEDLNTEERKRVRDTVVSVLDTNNVSPEDTRGEAIDCAMREISSTMGDALTSSARVAIVSEMIEADKGSGDERIFATAQREVVRQMQEERRLKDTTSPVRAEEQEEAAGDAFALAVRALEDHTTATSDMHAKAASDAQERLVVELVSVVKENPALMAELKAEAVATAMPQLAVSVTDVPEGQEEQELLVQELAKRLQEDQSTVQQVSETSKQLIQREEARKNLQQKLVSELKHTDSSAGSVHSNTEQTPEQAALASLSTNYRAEIAAEARAVVLDQMRDEVAQSQSEGLDGQITVLLRRAQLQVQEEMCSEMRRDESVLASIQAEPLTPVSGDVAVFEKIQALGTVAAARVEDEIAAHREDEVSADESRVVCEQVCLEVETKILHELVADMKRDDNVMVELQAVASADEDTAAMVRIKSDAVSALQWSRRGTVPPGSEQSLVNEMAARMRDDPATLEKVRADARVQLQDECHRDTWRRAAHADVARDVSLKHGGLNSSADEQTPEQAALASLSTNYRAEIAAEARAVVLADVKQEAAQSQSEGLDGQITALLRRAQLQVQEEMCSEMRRDQNVMSDVSSVRSRLLTPTATRLSDVATPPRLERTQQPLFSDTSSAVDEVTECIAAAEVSLQREMEKEIKENASLMHTIQEQARETAQKGAPSGIEAARRLARETVLDKGSLGGADPEIESITLSARDDAVAMEAVRRLAEHQLREESAQEAPAPELPLSATDEVETQLASGGVITEQTRRDAQQVAVTAVAHMQGELLLETAKQGVLEELVSEMRRDTFKHVSHTPADAVVNKVLGKLLHEEKDRLWDAQDWSATAHTTTRDSAAVRGLQDVLALVVPKVQRRMSEVEVSRGEVPQDLARSEATCLLADVSDTFVNLMAEGIKSDEAVMEGLQAMARSLVDAEVELKENFAASPSLCTAARGIRSRRSSMHSVSTPRGGFLEPRTPLSADDAVLAKMQQAIRQDARSMKHLRDRAAKEAASQSDLAVMQASISAMATPSGPLVEGVAFEQVSKVASQRLLENAHESVLRDVTASLEDALPGSGNQAVDDEAERLLLAAQNAIIAEIRDSPMQHTTPPMSQLFAGHDASRITERATQKVRASHSWGMPAAIISNIRQELVTEVAKRLQDNTVVFDEIHQHAAHAAQSEATGRRHVASLPSYPAVWERSLDGVLQAGSTSKPHAHKALLKDLTDTLQSDPAIMATLTTAAEQVFKQEAKYATSSTLPTGNDRAQIVTALQTEHQEEVVGEAKQQLFVKTYGDLARHSFGDTPRTHAPQQTAAEAEADVLLAEAQHSVVDNILREMRASQRHPSTSPSPSSEPSRFESVSRRVRDSLTRSLSPPERSAEVPPTPMLHKTEVEQNIRANPKAMAWLASEALSEAAQEEAHVNALNRIYEATAASDSTVDDVAEALKKDSTVMSYVVESVKAEVLRERAAEGKQNEVDTQEVLSATCESLIAGMVAEHTAAHPRKRNMVAAAEAQVRSQLYNAIAGSQIAPTQRQCPADVAASLAMAAETPQRGHSSSTGRSSSTAASPEASFARVEDAKRRTITAAKASAVQAVNSRMLDARSNGSQSEGGAPSTPALSALTSSLRAVPFLHTAFEEVAMGHERLLREFFASCYALVCTFLTQAVRVVAPKSKPHVVPSSSSPSLPLLPLYTSQAPRIAVHCLGGEELYTVADECELTLEAFSGDALSPSRALSISTSRSQVEATPSPAPAMEMQDDDDEEAAAEEAEAQSVVAFPMRTAPLPLQSRPTASPEETPITPQPQQRSTSRTPPQRQSTPHRAESVVVHITDTALPQEERLKGTIEAELSSAVVAVDADLTWEEVMEAICVSHLSEGDATVRASGPIGRRVLTILESISNRMQFPRTLTLVEEMAGEEAPQPHHASPNMAELEDDMNGLLQAAEELLHGSAANSVRETPLASETHELEANMLPPGVLHLPLEVQPERSEVGVQATVERAQRGVGEAVSTSVSVSVSAGTSPRRRRHAPPRTPPGTPSSSSPRRHSVVSPLRQNRSVVRSQSRSPTPRTTPPPSSSTGLSPREAQRLATKRVSEKRREATRSLSRVRSVSAAEERGMRQRRSLTASPGRTLSLTRVSLSPPAFGKVHPVCPPLLSGRSAEPRSMSARRDETRQLGRQFARTVEAVPRRSANQTRTLSPVWVPPPGLAHPRGLFQTSFL